MLKKIFLFFFLSRSHSQDQLFPPEPYYKVQNLTFQFFQELNKTDFNFLDRLKKN